MAFKHLVFLISLGFAVSLPEPVPNVQVDIDVNVNNDFIPLDKASIAPIVEVVCDVLAADFRKLGTYPATASQRKELLNNMINSQCILVAQAATWYARIESINGTVLMSALQDVPLDPDTTILELDSILSLPGIPYKVFLKLEQRYTNTELGYIIITLDGNMLYPWRVKQMLELSTGNNDKNGVWRGSTMSIMYLGQPGMWIYSNGYRNALGGWGSTSLFPVEERQEQTPVVVGEVRGMPGQVVGFNVRLNEYPGRTEDWPVMGHVTSGMSVFKVLSDNGWAATISDCGLVVM